MGKSVKKVVRKAAGEASGSESTRASSGKVPAKLPKKLMKKVPAEHLAKLLPALNGTAPGDDAPAGPSAVVLDRLWGVVTERRQAHPDVSHSARLLSRGIAKVAQKFGEEAVECLIEAVSGDRAALIAESADVLYHLIVLWVCTGVAPADVWAELTRREGISGIAEKASRNNKAPLALGVTTKKIP